MRNIIATKVVLLSVTIGSLLVLQGCCPPFCSLELEHKSIVFVSDRDEPGNWDIYKMDIETRKVTRLSFDPAIDNHPDMSEDGKKIVFSSTRGAGNDFDLYIASPNDVDGTAKRLTKDTYPDGVGTAPSGNQTHYPDRHPHISHDGKLIVFDSKNRPVMVRTESTISECSVPKKVVSEKPRYYENLNVIRLDNSGGSTYKELEIKDAWDSNKYPDIWFTHDPTASTTYVGDPVYIGHSSFNSDGSKIIFTASIDGQGTKWEVYTVGFDSKKMNLVDKSLRRITKGSNYPPNANPIQMTGGAHFTADGSKIIYSSTRTPGGNSLLFWTEANSEDAPVNPARLLHDHSANDYVPEPLDDGRVVFVSDRGPSPLCGPPDVEGPSMDLDVFIMNSGGDSQINLTKNDAADEMLLIADEVSWFCGKKPNLSSCTYQPRIFNMEALWLTRYAEMRIPDDLLMRFNKSNAKEAYSTHWSNLVSYVETQPHLQEQWQEILAGTDRLEQAFPIHETEKSLTKWMEDNAAVRAGLFVLPSLMKEGGIGVNARIVQGCCGKKSDNTCVCSAPVLKKDCPADHVWKKNKSCYESDKTGCCD